MPMLGDEAYVLSKKYTDKKMPWFNVKEFGAKGDGETDDSLALCAAFMFIKNIGGGTLYFPPGIYMISTTIFLPSNIVIKGAGRIATTIKALPNSLFMDFILFPDAPARNIYRTMIATESIGVSNPIESTENVYIAHLSIDWNSCPTEVGGVVRANAPLVIDRAKNITLYDVEILDARPAEYEWAVNRASGASLLFSYAENCCADRCILHSAEYESLSVRHLSKNISFKNGTIHAVHNNTHAVQLARPTVSGLNGPGPLFFENNTVYIYRAPDAIAAHEGKGFYVRKNIIKYIPTENSKFQAAINAFDNTTNVDISGNYIDLSEWDQAKPISAILFGGTHMAYVGIYNGIIKDNIIDINFPAGNYVTGLEDWLTAVGHPLANPDLFIAPVIGGVRGLTGNVNIIIQGNIINVLQYPNAKIFIFALRGYRDSIVDNNVRFINNLETITEDGPTVIRAVRGYNSTISGNRAIGAYAIGVDLTPSKTPDHQSEGTNNLIIVTNNDMTTAITAGYITDGENITNIIKANNLE